MDTDDIWDLPVEPRSPARVQTPSPQRAFTTATRRPPLFNPASDDEDDGMPDAPPRGLPEGNVDVEALFTGVDDLPEDTAQYGRVPPLTPHEIRSSSPANDLGEEEKDAKKPKKKATRLGEGTLIGETGFPQLIEDTKDFKIKGKGHEVSDLNRLLQVYQFWTHRLYPKTPFRETVDRVEKLCHTKRMHNMLSVWKDQAHGKNTGDDPEGEDDVVDLTKEPESDHAEYASSSTNPATRPPSSEGDLNDSEPDTSAMDAAARRNARQVDVAERSPQPTTEVDTGTSLPTDPGASTSLQNQVEAETAAALEDARKNPPPPPMQALDDDDDAWDAMDMY